MKRVRMGSTILGLACIALATSVAVPAHADGPTRSAELRTVSVAYGPACVGHVFAQMVSTPVLHPGPDAPPRDNRGVAYVSIGGTFIGISDRLGEPCRVGATVRWRNLRTGASGAVAGPVSGNLFPAAPYDAVSYSPRTGSGPVEFILTTDRPHLTERAVVQVW